MNTDIENLLGELLDDEMREQWGWGRLFRLRSKSDSHLRIETGGLLIPYHVGHVTIDRARREVQFAAIDQKTPSERIWRGETTEDWWRRFEVVMRLDAP